MHAHLLQLIRTQGQTSRAELARLTGLSKPTVSSVVAELLTSGLITEVGLGQSVGGRPAVLLTFNDRAGFVVGMDVGGTTARASLATLRGDTVATLREATSGTSPETLAAQIHRLTLQLCDQARVPPDSVLSVAVGTPGVVDPVTGQVRYAPNLRALESPDFASLLAARLGLSVSFHNDVNLAAVGEHAYGEGRGTETFVFISIGTGLGFGLFVGGKPHLGSAGRAGELGYLRLTPQSRKTVEDVLSGVGISRCHAAAGGSGSVADAFGEAERAREPGSGVVGELIPYLAWLLSALGTLLDPDRFVLGGSIGQRFRAFGPQLTRSLEQLSPITPPLAFSELGDEAGLRGAVSVALAEAEPLLLKGGGSRRQIATAVNP